MGRQYKTITEVFDFGPHISKVILHVGRSLKGAKLTENQFRVSVKRTPCREKILPGLYLWGKSPMIP